jgi:hypothetical protein
MSTNRDKRRPRQDDRGEDSANRSANALQRIITVLGPLESEDRKRLLDTVSTFYSLATSRIEPLSQGPPAAVSADARQYDFHFSDQSAEAPSPKAFMLSKDPKNDVERVACLAYYLGTFRGQPHFKTRDVTLLNTESAHRAFSNASQAVENAVRSGLLVPSIKGSKQLSAMGEQYVNTLPDREAATSIAQRMKHRRSAAGKREKPGK